MCKVIFEVYAPRAKSVYLVGDFNDWDIRACPMEKENGVWVITLDLPPGKYEYRYLIDGGWYNDPQKCRILTGWGENSVLEVEQECSLICA
ncbi:isoamylase early set domain-containing protein [Candidatus Sordicultor fermentans]|jgi:1,4-alpha-glucan branching enzyme|uniref:isoamylase early set domain-containing protein n=1 Tax=Candidatus Sordicultor fermentans TaxID=1953203 RepID=UPI0016A32F17|nr:hypothetical protein [Candidatus Atribacteria bacterium]